VDGSSTTILRPTVYAGFTCNPGDPQQPSDYLCRYRVFGTYTENSGYMGSGKMKGRIIYDYGHVDPETGCIATKGVLKFDNGSGWVRTALDKNQVSCPDAGSSSLLQNWSLRVRPGAGSLIETSSGTITWTGSVAPDGDTGNQVGNATWSGTVVSEP